MKPWTVAFLIYAGSLCLLFTITGRRPHDRFIGVAGLGLLLLCAHEVFL